VLGQTAPSTPVTGPSEDAVKLDPFNVNADSDVGFVASSSLAGGRIQTALKDTPVAFSVITKEFLEAFNITSAVEAGNWSTNSTYTPGDNTNPGYGGNETGQIRIRGISVNAATRNFFAYPSVADSFNLDRIDFARGANSVLFGSGGAGGTQNTGTKQALTNRAITEVRAQVGSWNKYRFTLDLNRPIDDKVALRTNLLWSTKDDWRQRLWEDKKGFHFAGTYRMTPKFTARGEFEYLQVNKSTATFQYRDLVSAWDGVTYDTGQPLNTPAATLARAGLARTPQRFVSHPSYGNLTYNFTNTLRTTGLAHNNTAPNYYKGQPIVTTGWTVRSQAMMDGLDGLPVGNRFAGALSASPYFHVPGRNETWMWDDPKHQFPVNGQTTRDAALYLTYTPFEGLFVELAGDANRVRGKGDTAQRRGGPEFYMDVQRNLPDGTPNQWFLHTYHDQGHYKQKRNSDADTVRFQAVYVKETRIGKLQTGVMASLNNQFSEGRSSLLLLPLTWLAPDARTMTAVTGSDLNEYFAWNRYYSDDTSRIKNPAWKSGQYGKPTTVVDPQNGRREIVTPTWVWDARRETNVQDTVRKNKFIQAAGNFDLFKNRVVLIGAFRRDFVHLSQYRVGNPGSFPAGWDGTTLMLRPATPPDFFDLTYTPKDAQGRPTGAPIPADVRPRQLIQGADIPLPQYANDRFKDDYNSPDSFANINTGTTGVVINPTRWLGVYGNKSTAWTFGSAAQNIFKQIVPATISHGVDAGIRVTLPGNRLAFSAGWYHTYQDGATVNIEGGVVGAYNAIGDLPPIGASFLDRNHRNLARTPTNNIVSTATNDTSGYEFEMTANLTPNWRLTANYGTNDAKTKNQGKDVLEYFDYADPLARQILEDGGIAINPANNQAAIKPEFNDPSKINLERAEAAVTAWNNLVNTVQPSARARPDKLNAVLQNVPWTANFATDYRFRRGVFNGLRAGIGIQMRGPQFVGNRSGDTARNPNNPATTVPYLGGGVYGPAGTKENTSAFEWVKSAGYTSVTGTMSYTVRLKESRRLIPKTVTFDLSIENLNGRDSPIYGFTSTGGQNTNGTNFVPNDGPEAITSDPSRKSVPGNFFYLNPRNFTLSARMDF
jgi:outer membrane receptor protein involved in Fe transport